MVRPLAAALALAAFTVGACASRAANAPPTRTGDTEFRYDGPAEAVLLRGSMTAWQAVELGRNGSGFRMALALAPGRYEYRLEVRRAGSVEVWLPTEAERVSDGYGGENAVLRVR